MVTIVSGGQTGVDRAALDWAIAHGIPHGGWCPAGRLAEDGPIPARYQLNELEDGGYRKRTLWNVRDSDATLIVSLDPNLTGGSAATMRFARSLKKPWLHVYPDADWQVLIQDWITEVGPVVLNVAGPRGSGAPGIEDFVWRVLETAFPLAFRLR